MIRSSVLMALLVLCCGYLAPLTAQSNATLVTSTLVQNLHVPWEILWGPDNWIWFTERNGRVSRVNPVDGQKVVLLTLSSVREQGESGMLGMVLHPDFADTPHVFIAYTYMDGNELTERVERYTYAGSALTSPKVILDGLRAGSIHNGCRMIILPDRTLLISTGNSASDNDPNSPSLDLTRLEGKILRLNLDGSIPADNPFPGSRVFSLGHRNAQGLVRLPDGTIMSSEHGPSTDDEINIIKKGGNYGWPKVKGMCDQSSEETYCTQNNVVEPVKSWSPTIAPAGVDFYDNPAIPQWRNSLILVTLKERDLRILSLNATHTAVTGEKILYDAQFGRLRDVCISPSGELFIAVSNQDGKTTPKTGDDRIIRVAPAASSARDHSMNAAMPGMVSLSLHNGSLLKITGPAPGRGAIALYSVQGKLVRQISLTGAPAYELGRLGSAMYRYRITANGSLINTGHLVVAN